MLQKFKCNAFIPDRSGEEIMGRFLMHVWLDPLDITEVCDALIRDPENNDIPKIEGCFVTTVTGKEYHLITPSDSMAQIINAARKDDIEDDNGRD